MVIKVRRRDEDQAPWVWIGESQQFLQMQRIACSLAEQEHDTPLTGLSAVAGDLVVTAQDTGGLAADLDNALEYISLLGVEAWELSTPEWRQVYLVLAETGMSIDVDVLGVMHSLVVYPAGVSRFRPGDTIYQVGAVVPGVLVRGVRPESVFEPIVAAFKYELMAAHDGGYDLEVRLDDD
jgi:hypothetical protein